MRIDQFDKVVEYWKKYVLTGPLSEYKLEIDPDLEKHIVSLALYLDVKTVRAAGETELFYEGYRQAATDILNFVGVELTQDDDKKVIKVLKSTIPADVQEKLKEFIWGPQS